MQKAEAREKRRRIGIWKYVLIQGILWGVIVLFFSRLFDLNERSFSDIYFSRSGATGLLFYITGGILLYRFLWWYEERNYKKLKEKEKPGAGQDAP